MEILSDSRHAEAIESVTRELESEAARLDLAIAEAERVAEALADRLGRGELTLSRYDIANRPLDERIAKLKAEREALGDTAPGASRQPSREHWQRRWDEADTAEKRELLKMALRGRRLVVDPASLKRAERSDVTRRIRIVSAEGEDLPDTTITHRRRDRGPCRSMAGSCPPLARRTPDGRSDGFSPKSTRAASLTSTRTRHRESVRLCCAGRACTTRISPPGAARGWGKPWLPNLSARTGRLTSTPVSVSSSATRSANRRPTARCRYAGSASSTSVLQKARSW